MQYHHIAHAAVLSSGGRTLPVIDPSDGQPYDEIQRGTAEDIDAAVRAARKCYDGPWRALAPAERGRLLMRLSQLVAEHAEELAAIERRDCGKPTRQARADALALARYFEFYAGACDKLHGDTIPYTDGYSVLTWREPHGVTGHIVPWNYPMQIFGRCVGGALAAGNVCVAHPVTMIMAGMVAVIVRRTVHAGSRPQNVSRPIARSRASSGSSGRPRMVEWSPSIRANRWMPKASSW